MASGMSFKRAQPYILLALLTLAAGYGVYSQMRASTLKEQANREAASEEAAQRREQIQLLAARTNADLNWPQALAGGRRFTSAELLTIDLQRVWQTGRPILMVGRVSDIEQADSGSLVIRVSYSSRDHDASFLAAELGLSLVCSASIVEPLINAAKGQSGRRRQDTVAVVAMIERISKDKLPDDDSVSFVGYGRCVDVLQLARTSKR